MKKYICIGLLTCILSFTMGTHLIISEDGTITVDSYPDGYVETNTDTDILFAIKDNGDINQKYYFAKCYGIRDFFELFALYSKKMDFAKNCFPVVMDNTVEHPLKEDRLQILCFFLAEYRDKEIKGNMICWYIVWNNHKADVYEPNEKYENCNSVYFKAGEKTKQLANNLWNDSADESVYIQKVTEYVCTLKYDDEKAASDSPLKGAEQLLKRTDTDDILLANQGVCFDKAVLFAALLREKKIPCKVVLGKVEEKGHAWNEVYVEGKWSFVDATSNLTEKPDAYVAEVYR